jgi:hypothetical protein
MSYSWTISVGIFSRVPRSIPPRIPVTVTVMSDNSDSDDGEMSDVENDLVSLYEETGH